jgi:peptidoglycan/xylan/chitin deacetylase (PgdA/CDA1 family)
LLGVGLPIYCGGRRGRYVALTFDDGPGPYTRLAVHILKSARARATFFLVGKEFAYFSGLPALAMTRGALGDHTWSHSFLPGLNQRVIATELARTRSAILQSAHTRVVLFRPPYGAHNAAVDRAARSLGLLQILWSIDTRDAEGALWSQIADTVAREVRPGSIILMHENHGQTIRALKFRILPLLRARHLTAVTIPALLALDAPTRTQLRRGSNGCGHPDAVPAAN